MFQALPHFIALFMLGLAIACSSSEDVEKSRMFTLLNMCGQPDPEPVGINTLTDVATGAECAIRCMGTSQCVAFFLVIGKTGVFNG